MERAYRLDPVMSDDCGHRTLARTRARRNTNRIDIFQLGLRGIDSRKPIKAAAIGVHQNGPVRHDARFEWHPVPRWFEFVTPEESHERLTIREESGRRRESLQEG